jgi:prepilin-type processing-associated H-X9-DG protein
MVRRAVMDSGCARGAGESRVCTAHSARPGWTLLEVLVVVGIVAVLVALLLPAVASARRHSKLIQCQSNLRDLGQALHAYAGENGGWMYPVDKDPDTGKPRTHHGINLPPHERWPALVYKMSSVAGPLPYDPASYTMDPYDPQTFPAAPFTPAVLRCPTDEDPAESHTYVLNGHLGHRGFRLGSKDLLGRGSDEVILAGEKLSAQRDYFMQQADFKRVVDSFRHGADKGSNYLFLDGHVDLQLPRGIIGGIDPWDVDRGG